MADIFYLAGPILHFTLPTPGRRRRRSSSKPEAAAARTNGPEARRRRIAAGRRSTSRPSRWTSPADSRSQTSERLEKDALTDQRLAGARVRHPSSGGSDPAPVRNDQHRFKMPYIRSGNAHPWSSKLIGDETPVSPHSLYWFGLG